jgi:predicted transcriptional regulator
MDTNHSKATLNKASHNRATHNRAIHNRAIHNRDIHSRDIHSKHISISNKAVKNSLNINLQMKMKFMMFEVNRSLEDRMRGYHVNSLFPPIC